MEIIEVDEWKEDNGNPAGIREKIWIVNPDTGKKYLFKIPKTSGEMIAEVASYKIGSAIFGLSIPKTLFAIRTHGGERVKGTISKSFITSKDYEFAESVDFFGDNFDELDLTQYTLSKNLEIVKEFEAELDFYKMCIFDYVIANQDRHCQNWGFLNDVRTSIKKFAPLYDNGSSMFSVISDEDLNEYKKSSKMFQAYTNRAKSLFYLDKKKPKFINILKKLHGENPVIFYKAFSFFENAKKESIKDVLLKLNISEIRVYMISELIIYRIEQIKNLIREVRKNG